MALLQLILPALAMFGGASFVLASSLQDQCLSAHNALRALHQNTAPLEWSTSLAASAQAYAEKLLEEGTLTHDDNRGSNVGENLYMSTSLCTATCAKATLLWYSEIENWNFNTQTSEGVTGHFTQIVWKGTTQLGVGIASKQRSDGAMETYVVARYQPAGNYFGQYTTNVISRKPGATTPSLIQLDPQGVCCKDSPNYDCKALVASWDNFCTSSDSKVYAEALCKKTCMLCPGS